MSGIIIVIASGCWLNVILLQLLALHTFYVHVLIIHNCDFRVSLIFPGIGGIFRKFSPNIKFPENLQP